MSLIEVERKRQLTDTPQALTTLLTEHGYHPGAACREIDTYFGRPDVDYMSTVECLRVRQRDGYAEITYKPASTPATHRTDGVIAKQETNVALQADSGETARRLLMQIGMIELTTVDKTRTAYRHPSRADTMVTVDTVAGLGIFVEVEVTAAETAAAVEHLAAVERQLGIQELPIVDLPYRDLVLQGASS